MPAPTPFKRLIFRAVLGNVSPMVIRVLAVPDYLDLPTFDEVFRTILGWDGLGFIFRVHGQEYNSFRRRPRSKTLRDFQLRPQEKFLYTSGAIDLWDGTCGFSTSTQELMATTRQSVSAAVARLRRSTVAAPPAIG
jgi:hypothetical protein